MKTRHHVAVQMEEERQWTKDNGPIDKTTDQLWKNSGEVEDYTIEYKNLINESNERFKAKRKTSSRKEYFRLYWLEKKTKKNQIK